MENFIFDFTHNYILEDDIVMLRPLQQSDFELLLNFSITEPETWFYSLVGADGSDNLKNYINIATNNRTNKLEYPFIVFDKRTNEYAGSTRFYDINLGFKSLQLGYTWYGKKFRGTGLNKHCKFLLLQFAFEKMGIERFELRADARNERSIAAMKAIGCRVDGILRSNMPTREASGVRRDSIVLSILKEEWLNTVRDNLIQQL
jgi:RimJ/RimL family protein N-acetyltransferase